MDRKSVVEKRQEESHGLLSKNFLNIRDLEAKVQSLQAKDIHMDEKLKLKSEEVLSLFQRTIVKAEDILRKARTLKV